ncbi:amidase family protein [Streptomyces subrutilus]|uniref:amidase family protein n=1 Tax=Streptomyces subrutilus TaxID=36818 RepID=UPI003F4D73B1
MSEGTAPPAAARATTAGAAPLGLAAMADALAEGSVSARRLVRDALHRIAEAQPRLNAFRSVRAEAALAEADPALLDPRTLGAVRTGRAPGGLPLRVSRRAQAGLRWRVGEVFGRYDVVLTSTTAAPPLRIGALAGLGALATDRAMIAACPYAWAWNVLGRPGVSVPAGLTTTGLPLGAQLLGPESSEPLLLGLAAQVQAAESRAWATAWAGGPGTGEARVLGRG